ncbi:MAG: XrtA/PEP-CTERM system TPR-repeat protein PrsT, partial [Betaproteobacteria bacterium]
MNTCPQLRHAACVSSLLVALLVSACGGEKPEALLASAKTYLAKNDSKAAVIQIKNALQKNPELPEARFLLGKALLDGGDPMSAQLELRKALDYKYPADQVIPLLVKAMITSGEGRKAIDEFSKTTLATPEGNADLQTSLALAQLGLGNRDAAKAALNTALAAKPDYNPALVAQAQLAAAGGDIPGALAMVTTVLKAAPTNPEALKLQGDLLRSQGNKDGAEAAYRQAIAARADYTPPHFALVSLLNREGKLEDSARQLEGLKKVAPRHGLTQYLEAELAYRKKDYTGARDRIQQLLKQSPESAPALELAGAIEFQLGSFVQAESYLTKALSLVPDSRATRRLLTALYLRTGQASKAMATMEPLLASIDGDSNMMVLAGQVFMLNGNVPRAEEYFVKAAKLDPQNAQKQTSLALTHMIKGDANGAFNELEDIAAWDKGITADLALITAHLRRSEFDRALAAIAALEKKQPNNPMVYQLRGGAQLASKDEAAARKSFERALAVNPAYLPAATSLAALDMRGNKPDDAKKRFESVLAADANNVQALLALAQLKA